MFITRFGKLLDRSPRQLYTILHRKLSSGGKELSDFDDQHPCVFVLSTGRTGTQTLAALFGLATNIFANHEPTPGLYGLSKLSYEYSREPGACMILKEAFLTARRELLNYSLDCGRGYIETSPQATFLAPVILEAIPEVRYLHLVRDPRDVVRSGMRRKWYDGHAYDKTRLVPHPDSEAGRQWDDFDVFQKNLWLWTETNEWILEFSRSLPLDQTLLVRSEDVFTGHDKTLRKLFAFINAPMPLERKIRRILGKKLNAQIAGMFPKAAEWPQDMYNNLVTTAGKMAEKLGYEL